MALFERLSLFALRIAIGWYFFYAGITKVLNPEWSAAGYLHHAKGFPEFYRWFASEGVLPITNILNEWGITLVGVALILGIMVRFSAFVGIFLMLLYYFALPFPFPNEHAMIVDDHIIISAALLVLAAFRAGRVWGLEAWCTHLPLCAKFPQLRKLLG